MLLSVVEDPGHAPYGNKQCRMSESDVAEHYCYSYIAPKKNSIKSIFS